MAGRERSPNSPSVNLEEALALTRLLYAKEKRGTVPTVVAFKAMGYKSASGTAKSHLGALRAYGLIEGSKGNVKLSERGLVLMISQLSSAEFVSALRDAALEPPIFRDLFESKPEASDEALRYYLILTKKFLEDAANRTIRVYRETFALAGLDNSPYAESGEEAQPVREIRPMGIASTAAVGIPTVFSDTHRWQLTPDTVVELRVAGHLDGPAMQRLKRYVALLAESIADEPITDDEAPE